MEGSETPFKLAQHIQANHDFTTGLKAVFSNSSTKYILFNLPGHKMTFTVLGQVKSTNSFYARESKEKTTCKKMLCFLWWYQQRVLVWALIYFNMVMLLKKQHNILQISTIFLKILTQCFVWSFGCSKAFCLLWSIIYVYKFNQFLLKILYSVVLNDPLPFPLPAYNWDVSDGAGDDAPWHLSACCCCISFWCIGRLAGTKYLQLTRCVS